MTFSSQMANKRFGIEFSEKVQEFLTNFQTFSDKSDTNISKPKVGAPIPFGQFASEIKT